MALRTKENKKRKSRREQRALLIVTAAACIPALGAMLMLVLSMKPDLGDLEPVRRTVMGYTVLNWASLLRDRAHALDSGGGVVNGSAVRALGYMEETHAAPHNGESVSRFVLLPDAGNLLHPAHRYGDQMIAVELRPNRGISFAAGRLTWAWGQLRMLPGDPAGPQPLYSLVTAEAAPAEPSEIHRYFEHPKK